MKVRVIKTPSKALGGSIYDNSAVDPASVVNTGYAIKNIISGIGDIKEGNYNMAHSNDSITYDTRPLKDRPHNLDYLYNQAASNLYDLVHGKPKKQPSGAAVTTPAVNANIGSMKDGGAIENGAVDPNTQNAYLQIANLIQQSNNDLQKVSSVLLDQDETLTLDDAEAIVQHVYDLMYDNQTPTVQKAKDGGILDQLDLQQNQQPGQPYIIDKPLMKDGGHTFVTSQPAYTKKSHTYFGTSNAPARDSYTDNQGVTTSVKAVPREDATIEAEKGEYIYSDKGLYKILGKKHYEGGTPLAAQGGEFIFSAHRDMSIDPKLQKEAGLKTSSSKSLADNTPAKVLERNVDTKEYNRLKALLQNKKLDAVTKKTAQLMLDKMDEKLKVISNLQEAKKQKNPVEVKEQYLEQPEIQQDLNEQKQYAYGGDTGLPMYQTQGAVDSTATPEQPEKEMELPDYGKVSNRIILLTNPDGTPYIENGKQVSLDLSNSQDVQKYAQVYSWLGDITGKQTVGEKDQQFDIFTVPVMDKPQRDPHVNLPTVNIEGTVDPRWHAFLAEPGNLEAFRKMDPSEQEAMKELILEKPFKNPSTGYWDRAGKMILRPNATSTSGIDYDPRFKQSGLKLFGVGANGVLDWLGNAVTFPQSTVNYYATGFYENPGETTTRLNLGQDIPYNDPNSTLGGFQRFGSRYLSDPFIVDAAAKVGVGALKLGVLGAEAFGETAAELAAKQRLYALEGQESGLIKEVTKFRRALRADPANEALKISLKNAKSNLKNLQKTIDMTSVDAGLSTTNLFVPGFSSLNIPTNPIFKNPITNTFAKAAKFSAYAPTTYVYRPVGRAIGWTAGQILYNPEWVKTAARFVADKATKAVEFMQQPAMREIITPLGVATTSTISREMNRNRQEKEMISKSDLMKSLLLQRAGMTNSTSVPVTPVNTVSLEDSSVTPDASLEEQPVIENQRQQDQTEAPQQTAPRTAPITTTEPISLTIPSNDGSGVQTVTVSAPKGSRVVSGYDIDPNTKRSVPVQYVKDPTGKVIATYPNPNVKQKHGGTIVSTYAYGGETELPKYQTRGAVPMSRINIPQESEWAVDKDLENGLYTSSISGFDPSGKLTVRTKGDQTGLYRDGVNLFNVYGGKEKTPGGAESAYAEGQQGLARMAASMLEQGIDFSNIKSGADFQSAAYNWRLKNDPNALRGTWEKEGLTLNASPAVKAAAKKYGVEISPSGAVSFANVSEANMQQALEALRPAYVDNKVGVRSLGVFSSPSEKLDLMPMNMKYLEPKDELKMRVPQFPPQKKDYTLPRLNYNVHNPEKEIALNNAIAYGTSMASIQPRYDIPYRKVSANETFRGMSDQPFKNQADTNTYLETKAGRAFGDASSIQKALAERNKSNMENMFRVYQTNMMGENEVANRNLRANVSNTDAWNQDLRNVFRNNQRVDDLVAAGRQNLTNKYIGAENTRAGNKYKADMEYVTGSLPYGTSREIKNPDGTYTTITDLPFTNSGINPNWKGYSSTAVSKLSSQKQANDLATGYNSAKTALGNESLTMDQYINYLKAVNGKKDN